VAETEQLDDIVSVPGCSRTVLVSFLGAIVRRMGDWMPIGATVELMTQAGLDAASVRTAVYRLRKRGWLEADSRGGRRGYALTSLALEALAAGDEVIWHARTPAVLADGWCVVTFSLPESDRTKRHRLRSRLVGLGFGNAGGGVWLAPARMRTSAERAIAELALTSYCAVFVGDYVAGHGLADLLRHTWDLAGINQRYTEFVDTYQPIANRLRKDGPPDPRYSFVTYLALVDHWRKLPFRDPGLPPELLTEDWSAPRATELFEHLIAALEERALAHASTYWLNERD